MVGSTDFFEINLHDGDGNVLLGIDDGNTGQKIVFDIVNTSGKPIYFNKVENFSKLNENDLPNQSHFYFIFRPQTLFSSTISNIQLSEQEKQEGWILRSILRDEVQIKENNYDIFYIANTQGFLLKENSKLSLILNNISASPQGGARGTRVEIKYKNFISANLDKNNNLLVDSNQVILSGNCLKNLNILNQRGKKQVPFYVGFIGSSTILNDGSENTLTLSIQLLPLLETKLAITSLDKDSSDLPIININSQLENIDSNKLTVSQLNILQSYLFEKVLSFIKQQQFLNISGQLPRIPIVGQIPNVSNLVNGILNTLANTSVDSSKKYSDLKAFLTTPSVSALLTPELKQIFTNNLLDFIKTPLKIVPKNELIPLLSLLRDLGLSPQNLGSTQLNELKINQSNAEKNH